MLEVAGQGLFCSGGNMKNALLGVLLALALMTPLWGQGERGPFNGTVMDPTGSVVANATVTAINVATSVQSASATTNAGVYRMPYLQPGTYRISVSAPGFKTAL